MTARAKQDETKGTETKRRCICLLYEPGLCVGEGCRCWCHPKGPTFTIDEDAGNAE